MRQRRKRLRRCSRQRLQRPLRRRLRPSTRHPAYVAELEQLGNLRDAGILTEEEFQAKKTQILGL